MSEPNCWVTESDLRRLFEQERGQLITRSIPYGVDGKLSENKEKDTDAGPLATCAPAPEAVCTIREAWDAQMQESPLAEASGKISGSFLYLYPPGTPILVPGERVGEAQIRTVERCLAAGYEVHGLGGSAEEPLVSVLRV